MDRNTRLGCLVVVLGSLVCWIIIGLAIYGAKELIFG